MNTNRDISSHNGTQGATSGKCRRIRTWLREVLNSSFGLDAQWIRSHIANCPRCHQRLASLGRVNLALSLLKSQPHAVDLLMRANAQAIGVLKHSLRDAPQAAELRKKLPEPKLLEKYSKYKGSAANVAACIIILLLMKIGVFSSMDSFQTRGQEVFKQYYAKHVGQDLADEIFTS